MCSSFLKTESTNAGHLIRLAALSLLLLLPTANAQTPTDSDWSGAWVGTYSSATSCQDITNSGNVTFNFAVTNGVVTGSGEEDNIICYDGNCNFQSFGTSAGAVYGSTSGNTITVSGSWQDSCNGNYYNTTFQGTLNAGIITGPDNIALIKQPTGNTCVVNAGDIYQSIDGFGASCAFLGGLNWTDAMADMFFSTNNGAGLSLLRSSINPDGTSSETTIMQMAQARGAKVWSAPWTPPAAYKTSGSTNSGAFISTYNQPYAALLANYVVTMKNKYGLNIYALSVQNEPDYNTFIYPSCVWSGQQIHDFLPYLSQALSSNGVGSTKIMIAEEDSWAFDLTTQSMDDTNTASLVSILAAHGYFATPYPMYTGGRGLWQTEDATFDNFDGSMANGLSWASIIHSFMTSAQATAFHYRWLIPPGYDNEGLTDINGNPAKRLYVLGQFSRFVRPGYHRIGAFSSGPVSVSAYQEPGSGNFAIVAINTASTNETEVFDLTNFTSKLVTPWVTSASLSLAPQVPVPLTNSSFAYDLPAQSVVTFVGQTNSVLFLTQPQNEEVTAGDSASFSVNVFGTPPLGLFWQLNGVDIADATNTSLTLTNLPASDNGGQIACIVTNSYGSFTSAVVTLTVANPLYAFHGFDGSNPCAALVQAPDGNLYGTAQNGGAYGFGTVFGLTTNGLLETLVSFNDTNGATPVAGLAQGADGNLYGTTEFGGAGGTGTVYRLTTSGQLTTIYSFSSATSGNPTSGLVPGGDGNLYGTVGQTAFRMTTNGALTPLATFNSPVTGANPAGNLILGSDGNFYGATSAGGADGNGTAFQLTTGGALAALASIASGSPLAGLMQGSNGIFYGTTGEGGTYDDGTIFQVTSNGAFFTLASFNPATNNEGSGPSAALLQGGAGYFYGTTAAGGFYGNGTIFGMDTNGPPITLVSFEGADGAAPQAALIQGSDGSFYGTTTYGGIGWNGTPGSGSGTVLRLPYPSPPVISSQPASQTVGLGGSIGFSTSAAGTGPLQYQWFKNGAVLTNATNANLILTNIAMPVIGDYDVVVSNSLGLATSAVVTITVTNFVCVAPPSGLAAWWPGQGNADDVLGGKNGSAANGAGYGPAFVGDGFVFNGSGYVQLPQNLFPPPNAQPFSIELWFETVSGGVILEEQDGAPLAGVPSGWVPMLYVGTNGILYSQLIWDGSYSQISTANPVNDGAFHHVAVTYDGTNAALYVDGLVLGVEGLPYSTYSSGFYCQLGNGYTQGWPAAGSGWYGFNGIIDEVSLYTNVLDSAQILSIYNAGTAGKCTNGFQPMIIGQPSSQTVEAGNTAALSVAVTSLGALNYQWFDGTNPVYGGTNATLTLPNVTVQNAGSYDVVATNFSGSVTSAVVSLAVTPRPCAPAPPGIIAWWPGQGNALDIVGGNDGEIEGPVGFASAVVGEGFVFNRGNGCVQLPENLYPLPNAGPFSIELWFETTNGGVILEEQNGAPFDGVPNGWVPELYVGTDGHLYSQLFWDGVFAVLGSGAPVNDGAFHHTAVTYDGANEALYLDGAEVASEALAYSTYTTNFYCQLGAGYTQGWPNAADGWNSFVGIIDEVTLYSNALTASQVFSIYNASSGGKCNSAARALISAVPLLSQGNIQITVTGAPGAEFRVLGSTNLVNWQTIATLTNVTGTMQFTDCISTNLNARYYQLVSP